MGRWGRGERERETETEKEREKEREKKEKKVDRCLSVIQQWAYGHQFIPVYKPNQTVDPPVSEVKYLGPSVGRWILSNFHSS
jgi:hypothetical protein